MLRDRWLFPRKTGNFTIQWHLTNRCELDCRHCYDRQSREEIGPAVTEKVLADLGEFCRRRKLRGHVCLTGGNPFLHPGFLSIYRSAARAGHTISILGNPIGSERISEMTAIRKPWYYQISIEGLREYNDGIRGTGHFDRAMDFLALLRNAGIYSSVMLTLHRDNMEQVLPLAEELRNRADRFTFNRLTQAGRGASFAAPSREEYSAFLARYLAAARTNSVLAFKDGLFNIIRHRQGRPLFRGCTGYGCGAAFNFVAILPDGEVHACRKYPSPIGHISRSSLEEIYRSPAARRYRLGSRACRFCPIRRACGGCPAVTWGTGLPELEALDPHCFIRDRGSPPA